MAHGGFSVDKPHRKSRGVGSQSVISNELHFANNETSDKHSGH